MGLALIERYIFRKAFIAVFIAAGTLIGVLWVVRAVQEVDLILNQGQGIITYLKMTTLGVPLLAAAIAPLALLIGLVQTINGLNNDSELVVTHASGASRISLLKPFLAVSLIVAIIVYMLHLWISPLARQTLRTYITKVSTDLVSVIVREGQFQSIGDDLTFHIAGRAPGGILEGILILDARSPKETYTYLAKEGWITKADNNTYLILQNGQIQRVDNNTDNTSIIQFTSYAFNLSNFSGGQNTGAVSQREIPTYDLFYPPADSSLYQNAPERYRAELHSRLTGGLYPLMVGLIVLSYLGNPSSHRQGQSIIIATACGVILGLRALTIVAEGGLRSNENMIYVVWLVPLLASAVAIFLIATDREAYSHKALALFETWMNQIGLWLRPIARRIMPHSEFARNKG